MWTLDTIEWVDVELTTFCNIDCPGCFRQVKRHKVGHLLDKEMLSFSQLKRWVKHFPNIDLLNFCGSIDEPTLHPEILDIVNHFYEDVNINISSNGSTKTEKFWSELGSKGISVFFGIDGIDQESLEVYRIGSNFKKVRENWRAFIKAGGKATWQFIAFEHNEHLIDHARYMANIEGFDSFRLIWSHREDNSEVKVEREENSEIVCKYANQKRIFISHTGVMLPCCFMNSEFLQSYGTDEYYTDFQKHFRDTGGVLEHSLKYSEPEDIMQYWGDMATEKFSRCVSTCKQARQDIFETYDNDS